MTSEIVARAAPDYDAIVRAVQLYVDGFNESDFAKRRRAFHEEARIFCINGEGVFRARRIHDECDTWDSSAGAVTGRIIAAHQAGDVAGILLKWGDSYVEYHALLRIGGTWRITNKTAYHNRQPAVEPDCDQIVRVVQLYVDGFNRGGAAKFREAFHEDAWILFTDAEGTLHTHLISESFDEWAQPSERTVTGRIISVAQGRNVAGVLLGFDDSRGKDFSWVDFHSLLRVDGIWKITTKTATHASRAGGA